MKNSLFGFSQKKMVELGMKLDDGAILRYFVDFKDTGKMIKEEIDGKSFYWIKYESINEKLPILDISKDRIYRKLKNLAKIGVLEHKTIRKGGTYSFYALGEKYLDLIDDSEEKDEKTEQENNNNHSVKVPSDTVDLTQGSVKITESYGKNNVAHTVKITEPYGKNNGTKDYSLKDYSLKENESLKDIYINIIKDLNQKAGTNYKATTKKTQNLIKARVSEGFTEEDFKVVINKKVNEWGNDENMVKYLRPETLFGTKFESYLNQKVVKSNKGLVSKTSFGAYDQRSYDGTDGGLTLGEIESKLLGWE